MINLIFPFANQVLTDDKIKSDLASKSSAIFIGNERSCKTSLLFQAAVSRASEGERVLFIRPQRLDHLPPPVSGMHQVQPATSQHIKFMYFIKSCDLFAFLAKIDKEKVLPGMIILDDLHFYIQQGANTNQEAAKLCAFLKDATDFCSSKRSDTCYLLASSQDLPGTLPLNEITSQFLELTWNIQQNILDTNLFQISTAKYYKKLVLSFRKQEDRLLPIKLETI